LTLGSLQSIGEEDEEEEDEGAAARKEEGRRKTAGQAREGCVRGGRPEDGCVRACAWRCWRALLVMWKLGCSCAREVACTVGEEEADVHVS
jgi:hypothetical protein